MHFENTKVPIENVIGEVGGGFKVSFKRLEETFPCCCVPTLNSILFSSSSAELEQSSGLVSCLVADQYVFIYVLP